jgi:hypothetical protein
MRTLQGRGVWEADLRKWFIPPALLPYCRFRVLGFRFQILFRVQVLLRVQVSLSCRWRVEVVGFRVQVLLPSRRFPACALCLAAASFSFDVSFDMCRCLF